jgi:hypothetical protein
MFWRTVRGPALMLVVALGAAACNEQTVQTGFERDQVAPTVSVDNTSGDTLDVAGGIKFTVAATDNLGLKTLSIALSGGFTGQIDSTFTTAISSITLAVTITLPANTTAGGNIIVTATATDGNSNTSQSSDTLFLVNSQALAVNLLKPGPGAVTSPGKQLVVEVQANQNTGIKKAGYTVAGNVTGGDSLLVSVPLPDTVLFTDTLAVPAAAQAGTFVITGFAEDSSGRRATSTPITVTIQSAATDQTPPIVTFTVDKRVEVRDSITVRATDPSGITRIGWRAVDRATGNLIWGDSTSSGGALTDVSATYNLNFGFTTFPQEVIIEAFGVDAAGTPNRGEARTDTSATSPIKRDTITVVNGITKKLPVGGRVADAIYNRNLNEIYMTNVERDRLEIFRVTDTSFQAGIPVGSRPWGIALWPRDTMGNSADTVVVANSGGTNLSVVNVLGRREVRRHNLPNFLIQTVQTEVDPATSLVKIKIVEYDFSDRPEYLGVTCRPAGGVVCPVDEVYAVYSTTPTLGQSGNFPLRGTVRWEKLNGAANSHFFWEHAEVAPSPDSDTLQVIVDRGPGTAQQVILSAACGVTVTTEELAFLDTTFVRNSGNATHALIGEGGVGEPPRVYARAIGYQGNAALTSSNCTATVAGVTFTGPIIRDQGISPAIRVRDFISNTAIGVGSIAINFNGLTNLIRADSVYFLNEGLRLMGTVGGVGGTNPGMDLNFDHAFDAGVGGTPGTSGGTLNPNSRLVFLARPDANVDVFDTWFYQKVASVPIKDPVIGPLRVARLASGEQLLVGVTARGVVTVRLPAITNPFPARLWGAPSQ